MPMGVGGSYNYYDPGSTYNSPWGQAFPTSLVGQQYLQENQPFAYSRFLEGQGYGGEDALSRFARSQESRARTGYGSALATNPTMRFTDYLSGLPSDFFSKRFSQFTPTQRGENIPNFAARSRWIAR